MTRHLQAVGLAIVVAFTPMLVFLGVLMLVPAVAPALWSTIPAGVLAGFAILWRRYPRNAYPIGLLFVPIVAALLFWLAMMISWNVVGDYI